MNVGWDWRFGISAVVMALAVVFFFAGSRTYRFQKPGGSPLTRICQVIVPSFRKLNVKVPEDKSLLYEVADDESNIEGSRKLAYTDKLKFFDKAAVETEIDYENESLSPWRLCTVTQVEELKSVIRLLPVWASGIVFATVYNQMNTMFCKATQWTNTRARASRFLRHLFPSSTLSARKITGQRTRLHHAPKNGNRPRHFFHCNDHCRYLGGGPATNCSGEQLL